MTRLAKRRKDLVASMMRDEIYESAVLVLTRYGLDGMTMDRVAAEAGVGKASLYKYFANKQEMLEFIHGKAVEPALRAVRAHLANEDLAADRKLEVILRTWFRYLGEHRGLFNLFFNDFGLEGLLKSQEMTTRQLAMQDITAILQQGMETGIFRPLDAARTTLLIFGAVHELVGSQLAAADSRWPADELTADVMDFFLRGLRAEP